MNNKLLIRKAEATDIPAIRRIAQATWPSAYGNIISEEQLNYMLGMMYSEQSLNEQMEKGHQFYIAELDGNSFGFASVSSEGDGNYKLNKLYVTPITQKTGAGKALLNEVIGYAKQNGAAKLFLQVNRNNNAKSFYEKNGFRIAREMDLDIGNGYFMNDYIMELVL